MAFTENQLLTAAGFNRSVADAFGPAMGGIHFDDPGTATVISAQNAWTKASNATTLHSAEGFSQAANNRLQYDGTKPARCALIGTVSFTCASNNQVLEFAFAVNGVISDASIMRTKITTGTDVQAATVMSHPTMSPGDYAELWVRNTSSAGDITVEHGHVHAIAFYP